MRARLLEADDDVGDVTVHIDPEEDDTAELRSLAVPPRPQLLAMLEQHWRGIGEAAQIRRIELHYLDGRVHVELYLPLSVARDHADASRISARLGDAALGVDYVREVQVWFEA